MTFVCIYSSTRVYSCLHCWHLFKTIFKTISFFYFHKHTYLYLYRLIDNLPRTCAYKWTMPAVYEIATILDIHLLVIRARWPNDVRSTPHVNVHVKTAVERTVMQRKSAFSRLYVSYKQSLCFRKRWPVCYSFVILRTFCLNNIKQINKFIAHKKSRFQYVTGVCVKVLKIEINVRRITHKNKEFNILLVFI